MTDEQTEDDELTPEERATVEREYAEHQTFIREYVEAGWVWNGKENTLTHPDDPEMYYWINPHTYKQLLSPKLVAHAKQHIMRQIKVDRGEAIDDA